MIKEIVGYVKHQLRDSYRAAINGYTPISEENLNKELCKFLASFALKWYNAGYRDKRENWQTIFTKEETTDTEFIFNQLMEELNQKDYPTKYSSEKLNPFTTDTKQLRDNIRNLLDILEEEIKKKLNKN